MSTINEIIITHHFDSPVAAREKSEELIDKLYRKDLHGDVKPRTYRNNARKEFLNTAKKKTKRENNYTKPMAGNYDF